MDKDKFDEIIEKLTLDDLVTLCVILPILSNEDIDDTNLVTDDLFKDIKGLRNKGDI